jgi:gliding motility-associated lipoprotein GldD
MRKSIIISFTLYIFGLLLLSACGDEEFTPKPRGYFRIALPEKKYVKYDALGCPFSFEIPVYAKVTPDSSKLALPCWLNVEFPYFNATVYLTYKPVNKDLTRLYEEHRGLTMKHIPKANAIDETNYDNAERKVYGSVYTIKGAAASNMQFYLTDSVKHFIRGSLYFYVAPQPDSLVPALNFISYDVKHLVETFQWK